MDPEAQIVGADAWRRLRLYWLEGDEGRARDLLANAPLHVWQRGQVLLGLDRLARRAAGWSDLRRELYLGVLRRGVEGR